MDKNTPDLLLPLTPPSFLSLYRDELLGGAPPGRIRRARHRPPPRVRRPPGRGRPGLTDCLRLPGVDLAEPPWEAAWE